MREVMRSVVGIFNSQHGRQTSAPKFQVGERGLAELLAQQQMGLLQLTTKP
jgi:hypothetical protein